MKKPDCNCASPPREVVLYTRAGCHLCEQAKAAMLPVLKEFGISLREVDIDSDPKLRDEFGLDIPVIFYEGRKIAKHRVDPVRFRRALL